MKKIIVIICLLFCIGCSNKSELDSIIESNNYIVLDVRTASEYETGHVKDALHIPYDEINDTITLDKNKTILVYCQSGKRSGIAKQTLENLGYKVYDLGAYNTIKLEKE